MLNLRYKLSVVALIWVCVVIILGAYTRLTDAGLGCPDWPGCFGFLTVPTEVTQVAQAEANFPGIEVQAHKAWNEMIHRYFAGSLGLIIFAMFVLSIKAKQHVKLNTLMLFTVGFQAVLGAWTVTMNLMPLVVMGHLLGGFTTFTLILIQVLRLRRQRSVAAGELQDYAAPIAADSKLKALLKVTFAVVVLQIALGGWTAANYASVACTTLPVCEPGWVNKFDLGQALSIPNGHADYEYGVFPYEARMTIHILHRFGALLATIAIVSLILVMLKHAQLRGYAIMIGAVTLLQIALGISNVVFHLPLYVAVAHNFVGLLLLSSLTLVWYYLHVHDQLSSHVEVGGQSAPSGGTRTNQTITQGAS
jgi:heme a synthase